MDAMADVQPTQDESTVDWMRSGKMEEGGDFEAAGREAGEMVGGDQEGNGAAACLMVMIANQQTNNVILLPWNKPLTGSPAIRGLGMLTEGLTTS